MTTKTTPFEGRTRLKKAHDDMCLMFNTFAISPKNATLEVLIRYCRDFADEWIEAKHD